MRDDEIYELLGQTFEWDRDKARRNWMSHRVLFTEAATVFFDPQVMFFEDPANSEDEDRFIMIGHSQRDRRLFIVHVYRADRVRLISARTLTPEERSQYEAELGR